MTWGKKSRAPKQLGDFGEGLVNYILNKKGFEVAMVDHVGADLIAKESDKSDSDVYAVSVKTRNFKKESRESRGYAIEYNHIENLILFADQFKMKPLIALVVTIDDDNTIEVFIFRVEDILNNHILSKVKHGYYVNFSKKHRQILLDSQFVDYSCWNLTLSSKGNL